MSAIDQKWVIPTLFVLFLVFVGITNRPIPITWYDSVEDYQITTIEVEDFAGWIIQGRNDFIPILLQLEESETLDNIPGLRIFDEDLLLDEKVSQLATYKALILITPDGTLSSDAAAIVTKDWQRRAILLKGGLQAWNTKISATSLQGASLSSVEIQRLQQVRPFFHHSDFVEETPTSEPPTQERYIAPIDVAPPHLEPVVVEEEEGC